MIRVGVLRQDAMSSSTFFIWRKPIAVTSDTVSAFEGLLQRYGVVARRQLVANEGQNPDDIQTAADATAKHLATKEWRYERLATDIPKAEIVLWSVHLRNGIRRSGLTVHEVLALANAGDATVIDLQAAVGTYAHKMEVQLSSDRVWSASISLAGEYADVHRFRDETSQLLSASTRNWHMVTESRFGLAVTVAGLLAAMVILGSAVFYVGTMRSWSSSTGASWLMSVFAFVVLGWAVVGNRISDAWGSIFPLVEFQFGGGRNAAEARRTWRKIMWSVPILVIGAPLLTSWLYDRF